MHSRGQCQSGGEPVKGVIMKKWMCTVAGVAAVMICCLMLGAGALAKGTEEEYIKRAIENTCEIADKCNAEVIKGNFLPHYPKLNGLTEDEYLEMITWQGFAKKYPIGYPNREQIAKYADENFGWEDVVEKTLQVYESIIGK